MSEHATNSCRCPRCGYDQRGVIAAWTEACPLAGVCSECGLNFEWGELLNPNLGLPRWSVERRQSILRFPRQFISTMARTHWPWNLWSNIHMTHPLHGRRLVAYLFAMMLLLLIATDLCIGLAAVRWRAAVLSGNWGIPMGGATVTAPSAFEVFFHAITQPWSEVNSMTYTIAPPAGGAPLGATTFVAGTITFTGPAPFGFLTNLMKTSGIPTLLIMAMPMCCGLAFAVLPISRRRAKVRWTHIFRATVYAYGLMFPPCAIAIFMFGLQTRYSAPIVIVLAYFPWCILMLLMFWTVTSGRYLRMRQAPMVGFSVVVLGVLSPIAVTGFVWSLFAR